MIYDCGYLYKNPVIFEFHIKTFEKIWIKPIQNVRAIRIISESS